MIYTQMFFDKRWFVLLILIIYVFIGYHREEVSKKINVAPNVILGALIVASIVLIYYNRHIPKDIYVVYVQKQPSIPEK